MCIYSTEYYGSHGEKLLRTSAIKPNYTYDLISKDLRQKHEDAARQIGIHGFCYEHIWNCGLPLFNSPLSLIIAEDCPNLPFCFHWITNGEFIHEKEDWTHHIHYLASFFKQKKYININDTPILMVNDVILEPKFNNMWIHMRSEAIKCGIKNFSTVSIENQFRIKINPDNIITLNNMLEKIDSFNNGFIIIEAWNKWVENRSLENSPKHIQAITQWIKDGGHNF